MRRHPILDELDASLRSLVPAQPVTFTGDWLPKQRRAYRESSQQGTGEGPFVDVVDWRWQGRLAADGGIVAIAFLVTESRCDWSKSVPPAPTLDVNVSFHAYADYSLNRATFSASIGGALVPGTPVAWQGEPSAIFAKQALSTAGIEMIAQTEEAIIAVLLLPAALVQTGRHRLWHLRDPPAESLPATSRELLTRRRSGSLPMP